jgi:hypothetical protein
MTAFRLANRFTTYSFAGGLTLNWAIQDLTPELSQLELSQVVAESKANHAHNEIPARLDPKLPVECDPVRISQMSQKYSNHL